MEQQTPPVLPTPPTPQVKNSLVLIMSVLLIVTVAIAGLFYFQIQKLSKELSKYQTQPSPTPVATADPTASWKTYNDPKGKYSFKYPTDWTASKDVGLLNDPTMKFILDLQAKDATLSTQDWANANVCTKLATPTDQNGCTVYASGPINNSIQFTFLAHYGAMHTVFKNGNTIFDVRVDAREPNPNFEDIKGVYDQILSTFKFLGQNSQTSSCTPKFKVESGPELTASEAYSQKCYEAKTKEECEKVDIYRESTQNFGNSDGISDCKWTKSN